MWAIRTFRVAILCAATVLAGCTSADGSDPTSTPPTSPPTTSTSVSTPSISVSTSPTEPARPTIPADVPRTGPNLKHPDEKPPVMPLAATMHTSDGATAFAGFFIKTWDWAYATTSTTYMRHHFTGSCIACRSAADAIDRARKKGHHFIGDRFAIRSAEVVGNAPDSPIVEVKFEVNSAEVVDRNGDYVNAAPTIPNFVERLTLKWGDDGWFVAEMVPQ